MLVAAVAMATGCEWLVDVPRPGIAPDGGPAVCEFDTDCTTGVCDTASGLCVECVRSDQCPTDRPVCASQTCRGCDLDMECASGVCMIDGSCADPARVLYASSDSTIDTCSATAPCTFDIAISRLSASTDIVKLSPGSYLRTTTVGIATRATVAGEGATVIVSGQLGAFQVTAGGDLTVTGMTIDGQTQGYPGTCDSGAVTLHRVRAQNALVAWFSNACTTTIVRTTVDNVNTYGVYLQGGMARIENSMFVRLVSANQFAAVNLINGVTATVDHTTIAANSNNGAIGSALSCVNPGALTLTNLIVRNNAGIVIDAACPISLSAVDAGYASLGTGNVEVDPGFVDPASGNYRLNPGSPVSGMATTSTATRDIDGELRPQGGGREPGCDEIP